MKRKINTKKLVLCALFTAMSLTLFLIEALIPPIVPIPGIKIGLAYIPIILVIFIGGCWKISDAVLILVARILLSALISGNLTMLYFAAAGGVLSLSVMALVRYTIKAPWGSVAAGIFGAVAHNAGQLTAAMTIYSASVWAYLPWLILSAVVSGFFTGFIVYLFTV